jgi:DNA ligase-1
MKSIISENQKIPKFKKLTKHTNNKTYGWEVKIDKIAENLYEISTINGYEDGKKTVHIREIRKGKSNRSVLSQAILEAQSKYTKKEREYSISIFKPMLANTIKFELYRIDTSSYMIPMPAYIQPKFDGLRCISYINNNEVIIQSRTGHKYDKFDLLKSQLMNIFKEIGEGVYLDAELYTDTISFQELSGLIRLSEENANQVHIDKINTIKYNIFDIYFIDYPDMIYGTRKAKVEKLSNIPNTGLVCIVNTTLIKSVDEIDKKHDEYVSNGYEGLILRDMNGIYEVNKRSKYLQKYKKFVDDEFKIVGYDEGTGGETGCVIWKCITADGKEFGVRPIGTREERREYFNNGSDYIGRKLTVKYQDYDEGGSPRFPIGKDIRAND